MILASTLQEVDAKVEQLIWFVALQYHLVYIDFRIPICNLIESFVCWKATKQRTFGLFNFHGFVVLISC
jgi:hypothetical protein